MFLLLDNEIESVILPLDGRIYNLYICNIFLIYIIMKKLKILKLNNLSKRDLKETDMKNLKGGNECRDKCGTSTPTIGSAYGEWVTYF